MSNSRRDLEHGMGMYLRWGAWALVVLALTWVPAAAAQSSDPFDVTAATPRLTADPVDGPIVIDGHLDEPEWGQSEMATEFLQFEPREGAPATQPTEVQVLYGPSSLYVGAMLYDDEPDRIQETLGRRDEYTQADWFAISIDSHLDRKTAFLFAINAAGVQYDALRAEDVDEDAGPGGGGDKSWNAIWYSSVRVTSNGWIAEMQIPYSMLRFSRADVQIWGVHFTREIPRLGEKSEWPLVPRTDRANLVSRFGRLDGISGIEPRRDVQITPYTLSRLTTEEDLDRPGRLARDGGVDAGVDLKLGLGSNVTLNATINPDFGQVESDPAELNLTAFETFFSERRPFFIEGMQTYRFPLIGSSSLLYTRRIGAEAPIIGAAKLSGRTENGLSYGVLGAATGHDFDPARHYGVARVSQQIGSFSSAGGMITGFDGPPLEAFGAGIPGAGDPDGDAADRDRRRVMTGGADWDLRFRDNRYSLRGFAAFTHGFGSETGLTGQIMAARRQGLWTYEFGGDFVDDRFDPNDLGRQSGNDAAGAIVRFGHDINAGRPFGPFQRAEFGGSTWHQWSYSEGINLGGRINLESSWTFRSFQSIGLELGASNVFGGYDLFETRGLWPSPTPRSIGGAIAYRTDERRDWRIEPEVEITFQDDGGRVFQTGLTADWNIRSRLSLASDLNVEWGDGTIEWSSNESFRRTADGWMIGADSRPPDQLGADEFIAIDEDEGLDPIFAGIDPFDGAVDDYFVPVFGLRDTRALDLTLRTSYTFTPDLTLQLYSQFFIARARYDDFRVLSDPDTRTPISAYPKRNEFSRSAFQFNTVLRWEYRPGSVLFLVWTQERLGDEALNPLAPWGASPYDTPISDQLADTFRIFPGNVFLVKLNYTFLY